MSQRRGEEERRGGKKKGGRFLKSKGRVGQSKRKRTSH